MRVGDFGLEIVPYGPGRVRELASGQVLARPGQVYRLRLRNFGPLYCVADVDVDGRRVTGGGLVLAPWSATELERPIGAEEDGRFTVVAEGDEAVFGADGGRDDDALGLVVASFRRELPERESMSLMPPPVAHPVMPRPTQPSPPAPSRIPSAPPEWMPPRGLRRPFGSTDVERAAGTGLTGRSAQQFEPIALGPLEEEATTITLRLVIGSEEALAEEPLRPRVESDVPPRPAARP